MKAALGALMKSRLTSVRCAGGAKLDSGSRAALLRRLPQLLLFGAVCWSSHALVTPSACAQNTTLPSTTSVMQSALNSADASARAWQSRAYQPSIESTIRGPTIAPLSNHQEGDATLHNGNQVAARHATWTWEMRFDNPSEEHKSAELGAANGPGKICPQDSGDSLTKGRGTSPEYRLVSVCDWLRVIAYSGAPVGQKRNGDSPSVSDEPWLADGASIVPKRTAPPNPLLVIHLGTYDLPVTLRDSGW